MRKIYLLLFLGIFTATQMMAEVLPRSYGTDKHIQIVTYNPNEVYRIIATQGFTTAIELGTDEKIISANIGDSSAWLVNVQDNIVNLKPTSDNPNTNLNLISTRGTYQFFLTASPPQRDASGKMSRQPTHNTVFLLRFRYDDAPSTEVTLSAKERASKEKIGNAENWKYTAQGDSSVAPICVFDNGRFTYFDFGQRKDIPAIFNVDSRKHESLVNYHLQGKYVVVEQVSKQFTLRNGSQVASVFNEL